jgi:hypothetical protein
VCVCVERLRSRSSQEAVNHREAMILVCAFEMILEYSSSGNPSLKVAETTRAWFDTSPCAGCGDLGPWRGTLRKVEKFDLPAKVEMAVTFYFQPWARLEMSPHRMEFPNVANENCRGWDGCWKVRRCLRRDGM